MKSAEFTGSNVPFLATSKTTSYWKLNTDSVTKVVICPGVLISRFKIFTEPVSMEIGFFFGDTI